MSKLYYTDEEINEMMQEESLSSLWLVTHRSAEEKREYLEYCAAENIPANSEESADKYMEFIEKNL